MSKDYRAMYYNLIHQYNDLHEHLLDVIDINEHDLKELRYMSAFIEQNNLIDEYIYFRKNAHEKTDENKPFSTLTL